jgi:hypothetical protein
MHPRWLTDAAEQFWQSARSIEPFPRRLEAPVLWALPLAIVKLPRLWISDVNSWLASRKLPVSNGNDSRDLHACLVAGGGKGYVLLNGSDEEDDLAYSLAHEASHFMLDYWQPRVRAIAKLGPTIIPVLDGTRRATPVERGQALLADVRLGIKLHLLRRGDFGIFGLQDIEGPEERADRLALELLAPEAAVRKSIHRTFRPLKPSPGQVCTLLQQEFGLPAAVAVAYSVLFSPKDNSVRAWLGLK